MNTKIAPAKIDALHQPKILVVEEDQNNRDNLINLATALGLLRCNCLTAEGAMTALSLAQQEQPDLILLDMQMPHISGIELLTILRTDWLTRNIPVIAITALREKEQKIIVDTDFDDCLLKPYLLKDLARVICAYLPCTSVC